MKKLMVSLVFLGASMPLAFSKNESEKNAATDQFVFQYNCNKEVTRAKQDGVDPCEKLTVPNVDASNIQESDKAL